ncbi:MAG: hypothetical protein H6Q90_6634 [Deltaproteobacteria bacterium]|nr:hypothetical protein [Deltaproteobacteria bacterium]
MRRVWRWLFALVFAGACGFELPAHGLPTSIDASTDGAAQLDDGPTDSTSDVTPDSMPDAPPDAPPVWTDVETRQIPCSGASVTSTTVLLAGVTYRLRGSGVCTVNNTNNSQGDPEWHYFNIGTPRDTEASVDNGIAIDDDTPGPSKLPSWGAYSSVHTYSVDWIGAGAAITARYHDSNYSNNVGSLSLVIQALQ